MPRGTLGRIVIEIQPELKNRLHAILAFEGKHMKDWFMEQANAYLVEKSIKFDKAFFKNSAAPENKDSLPRDRSNSKKRTV